MGELSSLEDRLGYHFEEPELLRRALIHPSAERTGSVAPEDIAHARRLSWLGDSVLDMVVSDKLYTLFPTATKEALHELSVRLTNNKTLGRAAKDLGLEGAMTVGRSLERNLEAKDRHIMLAGTLEAILGAIFVDGGIQRLRDVVRRILAEDFRKLLEHVEETVA